MQSKLHAAALAFGLSTAPPPLLAFASEHSDRILEACPSLREGAVETVEIPYSLDLSTDSWGAVLSLTGEIDHHSAANIRDNIIFVPDTTQEYGAILLMINSYGGAPEQAGLILTAMDMSPHPSVTTVCASEASSAALDVLAYGDERYAFHNCTAVAHDVSYSFSSASGKYVTRYISTVEKLTDNSQNILTQNGTNLFMDEKCYKALHGRDDIPLDAMDMLRLGIVSSVINRDNTAMTVRADDPRANPPPSDWLTCVAGEDPGDDAGLQSALESCEPYAPTAPAPGR